MSPGRIGIRILGSQGQGRLSQDCWSLASTYGIIRLVCTYAFDLESGSRESIGVAFFGERYLLPMHVLLKVGTVHKLSTSTSQ